MFGGCLILAVVSAAAGLKVTIPEKLYEVARGDNVTLPCRFDSTLADPSLIIISWSTLSNKPGVKSTPVATYYYPVNTLDIPPKFEKRVSMTTDIPSKMADLILSGVTLEENKVFECDVKIPGDDEGTLTAVTRLVVLVAPSKPVCEIKGTAEYGQNINLTCRSEEGSPIPTYTWRRFDVQNRPSQLPPKATDKNGFLSLYNVSMETSGYYICTSQNKIRSATCNRTLTVMPPSMNIGSTAGIIGGCVAALLVIGIIVYCCCCRKKKEEKEYPMGTMEEAPFSDEGPARTDSEYRDEKPTSPGDSAGDRSPRGRIRSDVLSEERSERNYDRQDERSERNYDRQDERSERNYDRRDDRYDDPRDRHSDRRDRYDDPRDRYEDRRDRYDDPRDRYDDRRDEYDDRRDRYDDRRDEYDDRRDRRESDRRDDYYDRRDD